MALQTGLVRFTGNDGNFIYYQRDEQLLMRSYNPKPKDAVKYEDNYLNTRLAGIEFAACSSLAADWYKHARLHLPYLKHWYALSKFTALLRQVVNGSTKETGRRELSMSKNKGLAVGMELNTKRSFMEVFKMPFTIQVNEATKQVLVNVSAFVPEQLTLPIEQATMIRLFCFGVLVQDGELDKERKKFVFKNDCSSIINRFCFGEYIPLIQNKNVSASLKIDFSDVLTTDAPAHGWLFLGAELARKKNTGVETLYRFSVCRLIRGFMFGL